MLSETYRDLKYSARTLRKHPGLRTDHLLTMRMDIHGPKYRNNIPQGQAFQKAALTNVRVALRYE